MTPQRRWRETWALAGSSAPPGVVEDLSRRYREPHRAYHGLRHVLACLALARSVRDRLVDPAAVELALWYHDAVYEPRRPDNEERSASLALSQLEALGKRRRERVAALVLATRHPSRPRSSDGRFVVDIDLAILGASPRRFAAYERAIRVEYEWVPLRVYRARRRELLESFVALPHIYLTAYFHERLEARARRNLRRAIAALRAPMG